MEIALFLIQMVQMVQLKQDLILVAKYLRITLALNVLLGFTLIKVEFVWLLTTFAKHGVKKMVNALPAIKAILSMKVVVVPMETVLAAMVQLRMIYVTSLMILAFV